MTAIVPQPSSSESELGQRSSLARVLQPVREALLADATSAAEQTIDDGVRSAEITIDLAVSEADQVVETAREQALLSARVSADLVLARVRSDAHWQVLNAQEQLRLQLVEEVRVAVMAVRDDSRYPDLLDALQSLACSQLGEDAAIQRDPVPDGGLVAQAGTRQVDYRLEAIARRALNAQGEAISELWT